MNRPSVLSAGILLLVVSVAVPGPPPLPAPVVLRAESMTVLPNSLPMIYVQVKNVRDSRYEGSLSIELPASWHTTPAEHALELAAGEWTRVAFSVDQGREVAGNSYPITIVAKRRGETVIRQQSIVVASAPYFKPTIDGDPTDWKDAIPVTFVANGAKTTISTFWNRRQFCMLIAVEEQRLIRFGDAAVFDALQVAIAPRGTETGASEAQQATRFEYLLVAANGATGTCYRLLEPGMALAEGVTPRQLESLKYDAADVAVSRKDGITFYECSFSFTPMRKAIRPGEGREFFLSILVHDPDGTGIRDWGEAAGLWESQRNALAWSRWIGAKWSSKPLMDCRTPWGMCSSRY